MRIEYAAYLAAAVAAWAKLALWYRAIRNIIKPMIAEAEQRAKDGLIDKADRKAIVMRGIALLEAEKKIKLSWIARKIISKVVDRVAEALPDFKFSPGVVEIVDKGVDKNSP